MSALYSVPEVTGNRPFDLSQKKLEAMIDHLSSMGALQMRHDEVEEYVVVQGREVQRLLLQEHLDLRSAAEQPVRVIDEAGAERPVRRQGLRTLRSLVGPVEVSRLLYQAPGRLARAPQDASLNLSADGYSLGVRRRVAEEAAAGSFDHTRDRLAATTGAPVQKKQLEELVGRAALDFTDFYTENEVGAETASDLLVLTFDSAGIIVVPRDLRLDTRRKAAQVAAERRWPPRRVPSGMKRSRKRMAQVAAVYAVAPHPRTSADVVRDLRPQSEDPGPARPKPSNKRVWASVERRPAEVIAMAFDEAESRDPKHERRWVVLVDGDDSQLALVRAAAAERGVEVTVVVDVIHLLERVWEAAHCFHAPGTTAAEDWVNTRFVMLLEGADPSQVAAGMRRSATRKGLTKRLGVDSCARYLCKYRDSMRYGAWIAHGLPIATGIIEGACRYLVRDRMDKTGARWTVKGAEAVLKLRALRTNGDWDAYWAFHTRQEFERNHAGRYLAGRPPEPIPCRQRLRRVK
jgi:hypothetical protein